VAYCGGQTEPTWMEPLGKEPNKVGSSWRVGPGTVSAPAGLMAAAASSHGQLPTRMGICRCKFLFVYCNHAHLLCRTLTQMYTICKSDGNLSHIQSTEQYLKRVLEEFQEVRSHIYGQYTQGFGFVNRYYKLLPRHTSSLHSSCKHMKRDHFSLK
jgi:hypothetical protein